MIPFPRRGLVWLTVALTGCSGLQSTARPPLHDLLPLTSPTRALLADTQQLALLDGSEITVVDLPATPAAYWACLRTPDHRAQEMAEARRLVLRVRWAPHLAHTGWLIVPDANGQEERLRSLGATVGGVIEGVPVSPTVLRGRNGNVIHATAPLPPWGDNPCGALLGPRAP